MSTYFVYILKSNKNRHYIDLTFNLSNRISQHNRKHKGFTGTEENWELQTSLEHRDKNSALRLEKHLKSLKNSLKAAAYIKRMLVQSTTTNQ